MSQVIKEYHVSYESDFETEINQILVRITPEVVAIIQQFSEVVATMKKNNWFNRISFRFPGAVQGFYGDENCTDPQWIEETNVAELITAAIFNEDDDDEEDDNGSEDDYGPLEVRIEDEVYLFFYGPGSFDLRGDVKGGEGFFTASILVEDWVALFAAELAEDKGILAEIQQQLRAKFPAAEGDASLEIFKNLGMVEYAKDNLTLPLGLSGLSYAQIIAAIRSRYLELAADLDRRFDPNLVIGEGY